MPERIGALYPELHRLGVHRGTLSKLSFPVWLLTHPELRDTARVKAVLRAVEEGLS